MDRPKLPFGLYALCDDGLLPEWPLEEKAGALLEGGVRVIQLRMKRTSARRALMAAREVARRCHAAGALCIVNDRVDLALLSGADGVHLGEDDVPADAARAALGPSRLIGVTCRSLAHVEAARALGADYAGVGPIFATSTKTVNAEVLGLQRLAELCAASPLPVVAIAGIAQANIAEVARAGARMAAVLSDLLGAGDVPARARLLSNEFERGHARRTVEA
jgi:thiamine-phosphate pyrophosphorylase